VVASQSFTVPSKLAEARVRPSGLYATPETASVCPRRMRISFPLAASQLRAKRWGRALQLKRIGITT